MAAFDVEQPEVEFDGGVLDCLVCVSRWGNNEYLEVVQQCRDVGLVG